MKPIRSITAATDFSRLATLALKRAALLAGELDGKLDVVHVVDRPPLVQASSKHAGGAGARTTCLDATRQMLDTAVRPLHGVRPDRLHSRVLVGTVLDSILRASRKSDLLVLGARGRSPLRDAILGTTAERLLQKGPGPMLVVRNAAKRPYRNIVVPVDFSADSIAVLATVQGIAPDAGITLVNAYEPEFEGMLLRGGVRKSVIQRFRQEAHTRALARMHALCVQLGLDSTRTDLVAIRGYPPRVILDAALRKSADLIAIGKQGRSILERFLLGSVTRHVLAQAQCDVLVGLRKKDSRG